MIWRWLFDSGTLIALAYPLHARRHLWMFPNHFRWRLFFTCFQINFWKMSVIFWYQLCNHWFKLFKFHLFSVYLWEPLPTFEQPQHVHRLEGCQPLRASGHAVLPQVCPEEAQLCKHFFLSLFNVAPLWLDFCSHECCRVATKLRWLKWLGFKIKLYRDWISF